MTDRTRQHLLTHTGCGLATTITTPPRLSPASLGELDRRADQRDRWLLEMLLHHRVFTTRQITRLAFDTPTAARHRLLTLTRLGGLARFRPPTPVGSTPWHYVLGPIGAALLDRDGIPVRDHGYRDDHLIRIARSGKLGHDVGVNEFFTTLAARGRHHPHVGLIRWWSHRRCAIAWGGQVRPDGYGVWTERDTSVGFVVEYDLGTEALNRLVTKIDAYTRLAHTSETPIPPVLFVLPSNQREHTLHQRLTTPPIATATTTSRHLGDNPAAPVWLVCGTANQRVPLIHLALAPRLGHAA